MSKKNRSLRFGGDTDIPYKGQNRDKRHTNIRNEQEVPEGAELDDMDWDEEDSRAAKDVMGNGNDIEDDFYETVKAQKENQKEEKERLRKMAMNTFVSIFK